MLLERIDRIERLERAGAPAGELLRELRELVREAEHWVRREGAAAAPAAAALERCRRALMRRRTPLAAR
jgi:hypothetical protein